MRGGTGDGQGTDRVGPILRDPFMTAVARRGHANDAPVLRTSDLDYELPQASVATHPAMPRDAARLMVVDRGPAPGVRAHGHVRDLPSFLRAGDLLVVNTTRVLPARFVGIRADTRGQAEGLYLADAGTGDGLHWRCLLKARRLKPGVRLALHTAAGEASGVELELVQRGGGGGADAGMGNGDAAWLVRVVAAGEGESSVALLERIGLPPIPPYIRAARRQHAEPETAPDDPAAYQTVYARHDQAGSVAAPTAGLHFTPELLARLEAMGVHRAEVSLHVGTGTFKPVEAEFVEQHAMHAEWCCVPEATRRLMMEARAAGGRIIAVGTTSARTLESFPDLLARESERGHGRGAESGTEGGAMEKWTNILITPGHRWRNVDGLMTNFHLPRSTLMAMVGSFLEAGSGGGGAGSGAGGVGSLRAQYGAAIERGYRFYSYGDAMLIV